LSSLEFNHTLPLGKNNAQDILFLQILRPPYIRFKVGGA
jgi:hypothetical protein